MANISALTTPGYGKELIDKINEIIDWLNGTTDADRVADIQVDGTYLVITYINGTTDTLSLQDTSYTLATTEHDGLITGYDVFRIGVLTEEVATLNTACAAIEKANEAIADARDTIDYYSNYGGGGSDNAGDGDSGGDGE